MFIFGVILASIFHIQTEYGEILRIQSEYGKMRTRITPNTGTSYAVMLLMLSWWKCNFWRYEAAEFESVLRVCNAILLCIFPLPTFYSLYSPYCIGYGVIIYLWFIGLRIGLGLCLCSLHYLRRASIRINNCQPTFFSYPSTTILRQTGQLDKNIGPQATTLIPLRVNL